MEIVNATDRDDKKYQLQGRERTSDLR